MFTKGFAWSLLACVMCLAGGYPSAWGGGTGSIVGVVTDLDGVAQAEVQVGLRSPVGLISKQSQTSMTGEFCFSDLIPGDYEIIINSIPETGGSPVAGEQKTSVSPLLHVVGGEEVRWDMLLSPGEKNLSHHSHAEMLLKISAQKRRSQNHIATSQVEVTRQRISQVPQGTEVSLPQLLATTTPGVVRGPFGQMFFRGNHANVQYQLDGVQMPDSPSNAFGQVLSPRNIEEMEVITGGIPAEYGQRLSAVINVVSRSGSEHPEGEIELNYGSYDTLSPHLIYGGSTESGKLHYFFSANYNRTSRGLDTPQPMSLFDQSQGGSESVHNVAFGNSQFIKLDGLLDNSNKLALILFHEMHSYQIPNYPVRFQPQDGFFQTGFKDQFGNQQDSWPTYYYLPWNTKDTQKERNAYVQWIWKHTFSETTFLQLAPYFKYSLIRVGNDPVHDLSSEQFLGNGNVLNSPGATQAGETPIDHSQPSSFAQNRHAYNAGLKADYSYRIGSDHAIKAGIQLQASRAEGDLSIQTDLGSQPFVDRSPNTGFFESFYVQDDYRISPSWTLNAGLRWDATQFAFAGRYPTDSLLQPRIGLNYFLSDQTKIHGFYGKLFQPAPIESLRYEYNGTEGAFVPLQSYDIRAEKDDFYEVGIAHSLTSQTSVSMNLYYKKGIDILDDAQLLNTSIAQPYNFATGYAYGAEVSLKSQGAQWSEYLNYSYGIAKGRGMTGGIWTGVTPSPDDQFLDHVQRHTINGGVTFTSGSFWWTLQGLYGSGLRTGPNNSLELPFHFTWDSSVGYRWINASGRMPIRVSFDLLNGSNFRYPITIANGFNSSHYAAGRQFFIRVTQEF